MVSGFQAIVRHSCMLEHSAADEHASIEGSAIGPNTTVAKGEGDGHLCWDPSSASITAKPAHRRASGRRARQCRLRGHGRIQPYRSRTGPGDLAREGTFFGLGCAIASPSDFQRIAVQHHRHGGEHHCRRRSRFPFSLVAVPSRIAARAETTSSRAPTMSSSRAGESSTTTPMAWCATSWKFASARPRLPACHRLQDPAPAHRMRLVQDAYQRLRGVRTVKAAYLESDIEGIGKNFVREEIRLKAIEVYGQALTRYALRLLLAEREGRLTIPGSREIAHDLSECFLPGSSFEERMRRLIEIERLNAQLVHESKHHDDERGGAHHPRLHGGAHPGRAGPGGQERLGARQAHHRAHPGVGRIVNQRV